MSGRPDQNSDLFWQMLGVGLGTVFILFAVIALMANPRMLVMPLLAVPPAIFVLLVWMPDE